MKKILICFGTRPEAIKLIPLYKELLKYPDEFQTRICVTGQHRELLDQVLDLFQVAPHVDLRVMQSDQSLYALSSRILLGMEEVLRGEAPDLVIVQGDTTTTFFTALAAFYAHVEVAQVEAGLRTYDIYSPWPEEANRQLTSRLCRYFFAPTDNNRRNLLNENFSPDQITVTGNTVIDALHDVVQRFSTEPQLEGKMLEQIRQAGYSPGDRDFLLVTAHRRENFGPGLKEICRALRAIAERHPEIDIVYPVHLNPNVKQPVQSSLGSTANIFLLPPLDYGPFVYCMQRSLFILSDSGGVQEEAPGLGKPVLVLRNTTERQEAVEAGTVRLVGTEYEKITAAAEELLLKGEMFRAMSEAVNPYGDGSASRQIVRFLLQSYGSEPSSS